MWTRFYKFWLPIRVYVMFYCLQKLVCFQVDVFLKGYTTWIYFVMLLECVNSLFLKCFMAQVSHYFHNCVLCMQLMWLIIWEEVIYISIIGYTWHRMVNQKDKEAMFGCRAMKKIVLKKKSKDQALIKKWLVVCRNRKR
jgi:hypothetical protein